MSYARNLGTKSIYSSSLVNKPPSTSRFRLVHNVANAPSVDLFINGTKVLSNYPYTSTSDYLQVPSGTHLISVKIADGDTLLLNGTVNLDFSKSYTFVVCGLIKNLKSITPILLDDDVSLPLAGKSHVRFVHAAAGLPAVDVYACENKIFSSVSYGNVVSPTYLTTNSGPVNLFVNSCGSKSHVLGPVNLNLASGSIYTIIASGLGDDKFPVTALVSDDTKTSCVVMHL